MESKSQRKRKQIQVEAKQGAGKVVFDVRPHVRGTADKGRVFHVRAHKRTLHTPPK